MPGSAILTNGIQRPAADDADGRQGYTSRFDIPYGLSTLQTLDLHIRSSPLVNPPGYWIVFLHGGAFRDPLMTSRSIDPSISALFSPSSTSTVSAIASINYRLSPYPTHPSHPSHIDDESRNVQWPTHIKDVRLALRWLWEEGGMKGNQWVVVGHSVGGMMGMMLGMEKGPQKQGQRGGGKELQREKDREGEEKDAKSEKEGDILQNLKAVISLCGIYDFPLLLHNAPSVQKAEYEAFISGAFDCRSSRAHAHAHDCSASEGANNAPSLLHSDRPLRKNVQIVVVAHSKEDELVEWEQGKRMVESLRVRQQSRKILGGEVKVKAVEIQGGHEDVLETGRVGEAVRDVLEELERTG